MYAEDTRFFPDDLPRTLEAADKLWASYNTEMGDDGLLDIGFDDNELRGLVDSTASFLDGLVEPQEAPSTSGSTEEKAVTEYVTFSCSIMGW